MGCSSGRFTVQVDRVSEPQWNALLLQFADANLYQTWAYGAVRWGERQLSHIVVSRGSAPVAIAQVRIVRLPVLGTGIAYVRWGPVWRPLRGEGDPEVWCAVVRALLSEYVERRGLSLRLLPPVFEQDTVAPEVATRCHALGLTGSDRSLAYRTFRVDLRPQVEAIREGLAHKWRNQLNASERNHLSVEEGDSADLYGQFAGLYREMMARKRFETTVSIEEFERIQKRLPLCHRLTVLVASRDRRPLSALVAATMGTTGVYLLGATGDEGLAAKGSYLLQWHMVKRLRERGCSWYDLGGINAASNPGVYHFKKGLGGTEAVQIGTLEKYSSRFERRVITTVERLARRPWRRADGS